MTNEHLQNVLHLTIQVTVSLYGDEPFGQQTILEREITTILETCRDRLRDHVQHNIEDTLLATVTAEPDEDYQVSAIAVPIDHFRQAMAGIFHDGYTRAMTEVLIWLEGRYGNTDHGQRLLRAFKAKFTNPPSSSPHWGAGGAKGD